MTPTARRRAWIRGGIGAAVVALAVLGFLSLFERGTEQRHRDASPEAARNPYLAWQRVLGAMGHDVRTLDGPLALDAGLPPVDAVIFYPVNRLTLGPERSSRLLDWVERGGHLWVVTWTLWDDPGRSVDPILDPLGVHQYVLAGGSEGKSADAASGEDAQPEALQPEDPDESPAGDNSEVSAEMLAAWPVAQWERTAVRAWGRVPALRAYFDHRFWIERDAASPAVAFEGELGMHLLQFAHGAGYVTVGTDDYLLRNAALGWADHSEIALRLLRAGSARRTVWMVLDERWPSLWSLVWKWGWPVLVGSFSCLALWLWRVLPRFGPPIPEPQRIRRRLLEHVEAAGRLLARDHPEVLVDATREGLRETLRQRRPSWLRLPPDELADRVARVASLDSAVVSEAFAETSPASRRVPFTRMIATLERIRRAL